MNKFGLDTQIMNGEYKLINIPFMSTERRTQNQETIALANGIGLG